jgi:MoaA/NifB/PqqE/SkfB family radical SAM enzyme
MDKKLIASSYCVHSSNFPHIGNSGHVHLCCKNHEHHIPYNIKEHKLSDIWQSPEMISYRQQFADKSEVKGCHKCYNVEDSTDAGLSFRQKQLAGLRRTRRGDKQHRHIPYDDTIIRGLDLRIGSTCNLECIMCGPNDSSSIYKKIDQMKDYFGYTDNRTAWLKEEYAPDRNDWSQYDQSWDNILGSIDSNLRRIYIAGGEPFYIKNFEEVLLELVHASPKSGVDINTNATRRFTERSVHKFKDANLKLAISIDGFGKAEEYIRQNTVWDDKVEVIRQYVKYFNVNQFDLTICSLSIRTIDKLIIWLSTEFPGTTINMRPVINRKGLALSDLPMEFRTDIIEWFGSVSHDNFSQQFQHTYHELIAPYTGNKAEVRELSNYYDEYGSVKLSEFDPVLSDWLNNGL